MIYWKNIMSISNKLFLKAKNIVAANNNLSASYLQRKLGVGYNRAVVLHTMLRWSKYLKNDYRYRRYISKNKKQRLYSK